MLTTGQCCTGTETGNSHVEELYRWKYALGVVLLHIRYDVMYYVVFIMLEMFTLSVEWMMA